MVRFSYFAEEQTALSRVGCVATHQIKTRKWFDSSHLPWNPCEMGEPGRPGGFSPCCLI
ncbi:MAG: hypothetical protein JXA96_08190 [Sedimentisphaerales bacterium]|nr:hypothetical protein [Sedimentisphaerales bacterium]